MNRRQRLTLLRIVLLGSMFPFAQLAAAEERPPNVVVVLTDDQGWGDLSVHGNTNLQTPNIDSLARDGTPASAARGRRRPNKATCTARRWRRAA